MELGHPDFQLLFDALIRMTEKVVDGQGGFLPHGAIVLPDGKIGYVGAMHEKEQPGAPATLELLEGGLRGMAAKGTLRAAGMAIDTLLKAPPRNEDIGKDAIWIVLEHKDGASIGVVTPYVWHGRFRFDAPFTIPARPRIFTPPPS